VLVFGEFFGISFDFLGTNNKLKTTHKINMQEKQKYA
jgi:hypothetical protein